MRIGCLQFAPKVGDVDNNLNRADAVLSRADVEELDLLVLPELAFTVSQSLNLRAMRDVRNGHPPPSAHALSDRLRLCAFIFRTLVTQDELITDTKTRTGYNFKSLKEIAPYLEPSGSGITSLWARTVALKYNCTVIAGYPEKVDVTPKWPTSPEYYNSAIVVSPDGETIANYRKSFLYYTDETWALEGDGFYSGFLPNIGFASLGICMDLNPYKFEAPWHEYEFAFHALDVSANVVIVSMAWMTREEPREFSRMPNEPDLETLTYWITRLEPLVRADRRDEIIVVFVNRCGIEGDATYAGTSAVLGVHHGEVTVYGLLGRGEKQLLVVDTTHPPYGKLLYRPEYPDKAGVPHGHGKPPTSELDGQDFGVPDQGSDSFYDAPDSDSPRQDTDSQSPRQEADGAGTPVAPDRPHNGMGLAVSMNQASQAGTSFPGQSRNTSSIVKLESISASKSIKQAPVAPIKIPEMVPPDLAADLQTPREDGTTSAPIQVMHSPRTAVRPRLVIPQSPTMVPQQFYPDQPVSAASVMSGKSMHSIRSEDSQASVQTIRSNPRPPEDSTPYPHSGAPLSGYPKRKQIYGGSVAIGQEGLGFVPITPFDEMSPISAASWAWPQSANPFGSLNAASAWPSDTPLAVVPEPLPWSSMRAPSRPRSRSTRCLHSNGIAPARRPTPPVTGWSQPRNQPDSHEAINEAVDEWTRVSRNMEQPESEDPDAGSARPASPKSRNASRSRLHERPGSAMGKPDFSAAAQHLENVAKRVSSVPRPREKQEYSETESYFDAASSREDSPSKEGDIRTGFELSDTVIPIVASPSLLGVDSQRHAMVPTPVALDYYRSASNPAQNHATPSLSSRGARTQSRKLFRTKESAYDRTPSRGRQPRPKTTMTTAEHDRARRVRSTSMDSTRNDLLHRHVRRASANGGDSLGRNQSRNTIHGNIPLPDGYTAEDFERVEEIACPDCPVHGHRSSSANNSVGNAAGRRVSSQNRPRRRRSTSQNLGGLFNSPVPERFKLPLSPAPGSDRQSEPRRIPEPRFAPAPVQRPAKKRLHKVKRSFTASPVPRPSTAPLPFNPPTPKAMSFIPDVGDLDSLDEDGPVLTTTIKGKFVDTQKEMGMQLSALA
ncbi:hypothetical protein NHJ13051_003401 [Beauveria bassiana]